jgi:hypothetical protein
MCWWKKIITPWQNWNIRAAHLDGRPPTTTWPRAPGNGDDAAAGTKRKETERKRMARVTRVRCAASS